MGPEKVAQTKGLLLYSHTHPSYIGDSIRVCVADNTECLFNVAAKSEH